MLLYTVQDMKQWVVRRLGCGVIVATLVGGCGRGTDSSPAKAAITVDAAAVLPPLIERTDAEIRNAMFDDRFRLLAAAIDRTSSGVLLHAGWEAATDTALDRLICVHMVDATGKILAGADYKQAQFQPQLSSPVKAGTRWVDDVAVDNTRLAGAVRIALCMYHETESHLLIDRGPRDWKNLRLLLPIPPAK